MESEVTPPLRGRVYDIGKVLNYNLFLFKISEVIDIQKEVSNSVLRNYSYRYEKKKI
jgi:hypothetical protein